MLRENLHIEIWIKCGERERGGGRRRGRERERERIVDRILYIFIETVEG